MSEPSVTFSLALIVYFCGPVLKEPLKWTQVLRILVAFDEFSPVSDELWFGILVEIRKVLEKISGTY